MSILEWLFFWLLTTQITGLVLPNSTFWWNCRQKVAAPLTFAFAAAYFSQDNFTTATDCEPLLLLSLLCVSAQSVCLSMWQCSLECWSYGYNFCLQCVVHVVNLKCFYLCQPCRTRLFCHRETHQYLKNLFMGFTEAMYLQDLFPRKTD